MYQTDLRARSVFGRQEFVLLVFNEVISLYLLKKKKLKKEKKKRRGAIKIVKASNRSRRSPLIHHQIQRPSYATSSIRGSPYPPIKTNQRPLHASSASRRFRLQTPPNPTALKSPCHQSASSPSTQSKST